MPVQQLTRWSTILGLAVSLMCGSAMGQDKQTPAAAAQENATTEQKPKASEPTDPLKRELSDKQKKENAKRFKKEVGESYKKWLDEDVAWIITDEERQAFKALSNDEERDNFIEQFWLRRDPTPDTVENEYKEEHYRRIAYANEHFAAGIPGWRTDRGRIYIMYGPPDEIEAHPSGGFYQRPEDEGGGTTSTFPFETWRYRYLENVGQEVMIEFVDSCQCGDYHMTLDRSEKDALKNVPGAGLTDYESMGLASKTDRFNNGFEQLGKGPFNQDMDSKQFDRLETFAKLNTPPPVKFKDLSEIVTHKINMNLMPFDVRMDFVKVLSDTALVPVTIQIKNKDITFSAKDGVQRGTVNIFGRLTTLTGRIAQTFEDTVQVDVPTELLPKTLENQSVYWKALPLKSGRYRMDIVVKDLNGDRVGTWSRGIMVPEYSEDKLASSTLILADMMEKAPRQTVGTGSFVIGMTKVRPRVASSDGKPPSFKQDQNMNLWMQVYNLERDKQTSKPSATVEYDIVNTATKKSVVHLVENTSEMGNVGDQITLEKRVPLASLVPGVYEVTVTVNDKVSGQTIKPTAKFAVEGAPVVASVAQPK
jgi:GWxTD domain-containing protein